MIRHILIIAATAAASGASLAGTMLPFVNVTGNSATDAAIGESQLAVELIEAIAGHADFRFTNSGQWSSSITDIYFNNDPSVFERIALIDDSHSGVSFSEGAAPPNPPGLGGFGTAFRLDSDGGRGGVAGNGVNPGEWLTVRMDLIDTVSFADLLQAFNQGLGIAIHVQAFDGGGSETFVTMPPRGTPIVPMPAGGAMAAAGLGLLMLRRRR